MNTSLRSQITAGVAALGAAVVAAVPITQPDLLPSAQRVAASIELTAFSNPITAITDVVFDVGAFILDQSGFIDGLVWPEGFYGEDPFDPESAYVYAPLILGIIPDLANQFSTGPLTALVSNLSGYAFAGFSGAIALVDGVADAAFYAPFAAVAAVQELIAGNPEAALETLAEAIVAPLQFGVEYALASVGYIVDNIIQNVQLLVTSTLPLLVAGLAEAVVGSVSLIASSLADTAASFVANLADLNIEGAWNAVVDGLLGVNGTLGQIVEQTIGIGNGDFDEQDPDLFVITTPSIRSVLTSSLQRLGSPKLFGNGGILNEPLLIEAEATAAAAVTAPAPVAAVEVSAPEVSAPAVALDSAPGAVETPAALEPVVEAPTPLSESAVTTEFADVAPAVQAEAPAPLDEPDAISEVSAVTEVSAATEAGEAGEAPSPAAAPSQARASTSDGAADSTPKRGHRGAKNARGAN
jgi:hypothetical protein